MAILGGDHLGLPGGLPEEGADETLAYFQENPAEKEKFEKWYEGK